MPPFDTFSQSQREHRHCEKLKHIGKHFLHDRRAAPHVVPEVFARPRRSAKSCPRRSAAPHDSLLPLSPDSRPRISLTPEVPAGSVPTLIPIYLELWPTRYASPGEVPPGRRTSSTIAAPRRTYRAARLPSATFPRQSATDSLDPGSSGRKCSHAHSHLPGAVANPIRIARCGRGQPVNRSLRLVLYPGASRIARFNPSRKSPQGLWPAAELLLFCHFPQTVSRVLVPGSYVRGQPVNRSASLCTALSKTVSRATVQDRRAACCRPSGSLRTLCGQPVTRPKVAPESQPRRTL
ncbi:hypothetical protein pipiens_016966 [Culex pipiens pipiens]|uniref:Uncharacterized protein n=1 Tax=Culex pipiens pipiens TaxID=38569 RepID=A0ABD1CIT4_CULPP